MSAATTSSLLARVVHRFRISALRLPSPAAVLLLALVFASSTSCFVEQHGDMATVRLSIDLGVSRLALSEDELDLRGSDGLLHLDQVPAFLQIWVTAPDLDEPTIAVWPEEPVDLETGVISLDVTVPAGAERAFSFLVYVNDGELVRAWTDDGSIERDLPGGLTSDLAVVLDRIPTAVLSLRLTGPNAPQAVAVLVVDGDPASGAQDGPAVALPPIAVEADPVAIPGVPIGRPLSFRILTRAGEIISPTAPITLENPSQVVDVEVEVP